MRSETSEQRVLGFLRDLAGRTQIRTNLVDGEVLLSMTKGDIASYLGITPETLSRTLRRLNDAGIIRSKVSSFSLITPEVADQALYS